MVKLLRLWNIAPGAEPLHMLFREFKFNNFIFHSFDCSRSNLSYSNTYSILHMRSKYSFSRLGSLCNNFDTFPNLRQRYTWNTLRLMKDRLVTYQYTIPPSSGNLSDTTLLSSETFFLFEPMLLCSSTLSRSHRAPKNCHLKWDASVHVISHVHIP